jgi:nucleotide-binding universal stress UspA family protein
MRRVLVPLDGSDLAESIVSDALRLAGPLGELVLIQVIGRDGEESERRAVTVPDEYLAQVAQPLLSMGVKVQTRTLIKDDVVQAIDAAVTTFGIEMIACATHGQAALHRLAHGSIAWSALAHSTVPVLLRHVEEMARAPDNQTGNLARRILIPLDGSALAEKALPLAQELAAEWQASMWLAQVVPDTLMLYREPMIVPGVGQYQPADLSQLYPDTRSPAQNYLAMVADRIPGDVHAEVVSGPTVYTLTALVDEWSITDVVMASHGRTALAQFFLGGAAYELVHHLRCPVIVVPVTAEVHLRR